VPASGQPSGQFGGEAAGQQQHAKRLCLDPAADLGLEVAVLPSPRHLDPSDLQEMSEGVGELQRLLCTVASSPSHAAAAAAADLSRRSSAPSPLLWDAPRVGGDSGPFSIQVH
jgi:hypothetical protein